MQQYLADLQHNSVFAIQTYSITVKQAVQVQAKIPGLCPGYFYLPIAII
jgi:hypothetical protein